MKKGCLLWAVMGLLFFAVGAFGYTPPASDRVKFNFNHDWKFIKQDVTGAEVPLLDDSAWLNVSLPHTYSDVDKFKEWVSSVNEPPVSTKYYGIVWYRKHFKLDSAYSGKKVFLELEGITIAAEIYVNGTWVGRHENGVSPCGVDISGYVSYGNVDNVIAVKVNNDGNYKEVATGVGLPYGQPFNLNFGGLNRDAVLHISGKLYQTLPLYQNLGTVGTYIFATNIDTSNRTAVVTAQAEVINENSVSQSVTYQVVVMDKDSNSVLTMTSGPQVINAGQKLTLSAAQNMSGIHFWCPDFPYVYRVYTILSVGGTVADVYETPMGVRKVSFNAVEGLKINGHPIYLKGYAPRHTMDWPAVGIPPDWMVDYDFKMMRDNNANFLRPMHSSPRKVQVEAADKYGIMVACAAADNEGDITGTDPTSLRQWQIRLEIMRDSTIYYRNNPSVIFYEGANQQLTNSHVRDMKNIRMTYDPYGGRLSGNRATDKQTETNADSSMNKEYGSPMDGIDYTVNIPYWDAEYARGECPRRVWDKYSPLLNSRWDGVDPNKRYVYGGYLSIASPYHINETLSNTGEGIYDYRPGYFRLTTSEDLVIENLAKYYGRYCISAFVMPLAQRLSKGIMVGGAKIFWADSDSDGRMRDMEVARVSGVVDGVRLPKEVYYGLQVAHNPNPQVYVLGHWNYTNGTVKTVYVAANCDQVKLQTYNSSGSLIKDYGYGTNFLFPDDIDQVSRYIFMFTNVAWQPGKIRAIGYKDGSQVDLKEKYTVGAPYAIKLTPTTGPEGFKADGSDIAMIDVEVVDANGNRCPTDEDRITFTTNGQGNFLGGYNSGIRTNLFKMYINTECGINRVFVRSTRTAGSFILTASRPGLQSASITLTTSAFTVNNGLTSSWPQRYPNVYGLEPAPVVDQNPTNVATNSPPVVDYTSVINGFSYTGTDGASLNPPLPYAHIVHNAQPGAQVYVDNTATFPSLPSYLAGGDYIQAFQRDAQESSSTDLYQFDINQYCYIYQLIDASNEMPVHNNNASYQWQLLSDKILINNRYHKIYKSRLMAPGEQGYFACNGHGITLAPNCNLYVVFAVSAESKAGIVSAAASTVNGASTAALSFDGNTNTRWESTVADPQWIYWDLGTAKQLSKISLDWEAASASNYTIEGSQNASTWTTIATVLNFSSKNHNVVTTSLGGSYRYVRMNGTTRTTVYGYSIWEASIYTVGDGSSSSSVPPATSSSSIITSSSVSSSSSVTVSSISSSVSSAAPSGTLASIVAATASTIYGANSAALSFDKNVGTRWESVQLVDPQWIYWDLGSPASLSQIVIDWEAASASNYTIEGSADAAVWTVLATVMNPKSMVNHLMITNSISGTYRYVKMNGTSRTTPYGYSIWEVSIFTSGVASSTSSTVSSSSSSIISSSVSSSIPASSSLSSIAMSSSSISSILSSAASSATSSIAIRMDATNFTATNNLRLETCSEGGQDACYINNGSWLDFSVNIPAAGSYTVTFRTASPYTGTRLDLREGTTVLASATNTNTGGYQNWADNAGSQPFSMTSGVHTLRINANSNGFNFHYFVLKKQ